MTEVPDPPPLWTATALVRSFLALPFRFQARIVREFGVDIHDFDLTRKTLIAAKNAGRLRDVQRMIVDAERELSK